jgi:hypothetical protein
MSPLTFRLILLIMAFYRMKALLFTLLRAFEFELAVSASDIGKKSTIVQRPILLSDPENKNQLPLLVKPYCRP